MHVGRLLEQQGLWNSLYQLQLFARDLVRAAMTCIRFYKAGARCYSDMSAEQLIKARGHIEDELTTHWTASGNFILNLVGFQYLLHFILLRIKKERLGEQHQVFRIPRRL